MRIPELKARVIPESGSELDGARLYNLRPSSVFVAGAQGLGFSSAVTLELGTLSLYGEVALVSHDPVGALVVFSASAEVVHEIEELMDEVQVIEVGRPSAEWEAATPVGEDEDPTKTESLQMPAIQADAGDTTEMAAEFAAAEPTAEIMVQNLKDRRPTERVLLASSKTEDLGLDAEDP